MEWCKQQRADGALLCLDHLLALWRGLLTREAGGHYTDPMSFTARVIAERKRLAKGDPRGEKEAVSETFVWEPTLGQIAAAWDWIIAATPRGRLQGVDQFLERIAAAIEQLVLELVDRMETKAPKAPKAVPVKEWEVAPVATGQRFRVEPLGEYSGTPAPASYNPGSCRLHGKPFRQGERGGSVTFYCATKLADGSWCRETPAA